MNSRKYLLPLALCAALALTACSTANKDWANASAENTVAGYQAFLDKHAGDQHAQEAKTRIAALQDDAAWKTAQDGNSLDSYQNYLQSEPAGTHAQAARDQITGFGRASAWKTAQSDGSVRALQAFLQKYPQGPEADQARQKLAAIHSDYRAELGTFHNERAAQRKRSELQSRFQGAHRSRRPFARFRQQALSSDVRPHGSSKCRSACASLKRDHQSCEVVKADQGQS